MTDLNLALACPACASAMDVGALVCACGVRVEGQFETNEFAALATDGLHLLRVFVMCEGRIRDMEAALGVSYPTVKAKIRALKQTLNMDGIETPGSEDDIDGILDLLEQGELSADDAISRVRDE